MVEPKRVTEAIEALESFPLPELITAVCQLTMPADATKSEKKERTRLATAGHFAATKVHHYIGVWRQIDSLRHQIGKETHELFVVRGNLPSDHEDAFLIDAATNELSGKQEVTYHLYAVCAAQIGRLLPYAAKAAGVKLAADERRLLSSFDDLRDHFEHIDQRLPGKPRAKSIVTESENDDYWRIQIGFESDGDSRIVLGGQLVDVTSRGRREVEAAVVEIEGRIEAALLARVRQYFTAFPDRIPSSITFNPLTFAASN